MIDAALLESAARNPAVLATAAAVLLAYLINLLLHRPGKLSLPVADPADGGDYGPSIAKARTKYPNTPFVIPTSPPQVIVPTSMVNEWKTLPETELSFHKRIYNELQGRYTDIGRKEDSEELVAAVKVDLTRNIAKTLADLQDEVVYAANSELGPCEAWTGINLNQKMQRIVALVSGRVFVGLPLCRDEEWIKTTINYTIDVAKGNQVLQEYHYLVRPFIAPFLPEIRHILAYKKHAGKMLAPTMAAILDGVKHHAKTNSDAESPFRDDQYNMASWVLGHYKDLSKTNPERMGRDQMQVSFAAIHTTTMTVSQAIFDLATHPEYIDELRAEILEVTATEDDGKLKKTSMPKLRKLDSFIKESQRMHPLGSVSMLRIVANPKGFTLSTGHHLPKDTYVSIAPPLQIESDPSIDSIVASDSQPPLSEFHPFRYSDLRKIPGEENRHQFVTTGADSVSFGHGQWACPGRFFASNEIKVILIEILKRYDLALGPEGKGVKDGLHRPNTFCFNTSYIPDPTAEIFFKARAE